MSLSVASRNNRIAFTVTATNRHSYYYQYEYNQTTDSWDAMRNDQNNTKYIHQEYTDAWRGYITNNYDGTIVAWVDTRNERATVRKLIDGHWDQLGYFKKDDGSIHTDAYSIHKQYSGNNRFGYEAFSMNDDGTRILLGQWIEESNGWRGGYSRIRVYEYQYDTNGLNNYVWAQIGSELVARGGTISPDGNRIAVHDVKAGLEYETDPSPIRVYEWSRSNSEWEIVGNIINGVKNMGMSDKGNGILLDYHGDTLALISLNAPAQIYRPSINDSSIDSTTVYPGIVRIYQLSPNINLVNNNYYKDLSRNWITNSTQYGPLYDKNGNEWANDFHRTSQPYRQYIDCLLYTSDAADE